jgi:hypothetical protein
MGIRGRLVVDRPFRCPGGFRTTRSGQVRVVAYRAEPARFLLNDAPVATRPRWLIIVDRDRRDIFEDFRSRFHGWARVILDRRESEVPEDRYAGPERRRPDPERHNPFRRARAYRLIYKVEGFELHELTDPDAGDPQAASLPPLP